MTYTTWVIGIGAFATLALASVTGFLLYLNWNAQIATTILSVVLGGTVTLFIAIFSQLKETSLSAEFSTSIPFVLKTGLPGDRRIPGPDPSESELQRFMWLGTLNSLAIAPHMPPIPVVPGASVSVDPSVFEKPITVEQAMRRGSQLLQYKILIDIRNSQRPAGEQGPIVEGHEIPSFFIRPPTVPIEDVPRDLLLREIAQNPFYAENDPRWPYRTIRIPPGSALRLKHIPSTKETGPEKDLIIIERPNFFRAVITIETTGAGGVGDVRDISVAVTMHATFFKLTSGGEASTSAKEWVDWLFRTVTDRNAHRGWVIGKG